VERPLDGQLSGEDELPLLGKAPVCRPNHSWHSGCRIAQPGYDRSCYEAVSRRLSAKGPQKVAYRTFHESVVGCTLVARAILPFLTGFADGLQYFATSNSHSDAALISFERVNANKRVHATMIAAVQTRFLPPGRCH